MSNYCLIGLDESEYSEIRNNVDGRVIAHEMLPRIFVRDGELFVESKSGSTFIPVSKVVYHGIFENDHDLISGLAIWGGLCMPNAVGMMDCRLKLPCLVRALKLSSFNSMARGYASPGVNYMTERESVSKWGNWHCGENKSRFGDSWNAVEPSIIEEFLEGNAVRVVLVGDQHWQIRLSGDSWLKSIHHNAAEIMDVDPRLLQDTRNIANGFGLEVMANDYIVTSDDVPHLLEVNHIPNVTRFPEIRRAYLDYVIQWLNN